MARRRRGPDGTSDEDLDGGEDRAPRRVHRLQLGWHACGGTRQRLDHRRRARWRAAADALLRLARGQAAVPYGPRRRHLHDLASPPRGLSPPPPPPPPP